MHQSVGVMKPSQLCSAAASGRGGGTLTRPKHQKAPVQLPADDQQARMKIGRTHRPLKWRRQEVPAVPAPSTEPKELKSVAPSKLSLKRDRSPGDKASGALEIAKPARAVLEKWGRSWKPFLLIVASGYLLETVCELSAANVHPMWLPAAIGAFIGLGFTGLNAVGARCYWRGPSRPLNVVVTGSTRGIGKAVARELLKKGDRVMITSSNPANVRQAMKELRDEVGGRANVHGIACNVSSPGAVKRLADAAASQMGSVDVWINNAGYSGRYQSLLESTPEQLQAVVQTNLLGSLLCTKAALEVMKGQADGGHIFNIDGAGADGLPTPNYAAYGATKAGIAHLMGSLNQEIGGLGLPVAIHTLSPGMVLTPLLLEGATDRNKAIFNILCEQPETVAAFLTPRIRSIVARGEMGRYVRFLTVPSALWRFLTSPFAANRFFSKQGEVLYLEERERILGTAQAKITRRLAARAARQDKNLALAYSLSLAVSFAILVADAHGFAVHLPLS